MPLLLNSHTTRRDAFLNLGTQHLILQINCYVPIFPTLNVLRERSCPEGQLLSSNAGFHFPAFRILPSSASGSGRLFLFFPRYPPGSAGTNRKFCCWNFWNCRLWWSLSRSMILSGNWSCPGLSPCARKGRAGSFADFRWWPAWGSAFLPIPLFFSFPQSSFS